MIELKFEMTIFLIMLFTSTVIVKADVDSVIAVEFFFSSPCPCEVGHRHEMKEIDRARALILKIENEYRDRVSVEWIDVTTPEGSNLLRRYNITETPTILINHEYRISGGEITWEKLNLIIEGYITGSHLPPESQKNLSITAPIIIVSGLVDGVNPCAFALLIFFLSFLYGVHKTRVDIFKIGVMYVLSLFATYFSGGLGLLRTVTFFGVEHMFSQIGVILIILLGLVNIKDSFMPGSFSLKFPERAVPKVKRLVQRATIPAALVLGGLVGLCAFPCSGASILAS
ncbi:MAG: cytochrome c biogenesis protein [Candidatus Bathyarchaeia archaeon]